ncbi:putative DNA polymerase POL4 [Taphrina deformans PYCC 5710]|uniref:DNA polymerase n=1 Tax=Taphrina deformans (strain PYCC 5710 / ATCC 11124 / CBS 356.35 / IMI 108563 / JCM 9778 / NBRC 8474) TaxID=1097556 RepID=R4XCI6_TAPDE|nr:putative DNA polymerase POL4 [Taphrina deformans PYCC 5710]|eukprot:CCG83541.1 putative DNA polymerase POL4 [Taphrina deformans PYCC 5710]
MVFYFIPNSRLNPARSARMQKVEALGGLILSCFDEHKITHIVVDRNITGSVVLQHLKLDTLPSSITVYNEQWTPDSVIYGRLMEAVPKYQIEGMEWLDRRSEHPKNVEHIDNSGDKYPDASLKIKAAKHGHLPVLPNTVSDEESQILESVSPTIAFLDSNISLLEGSTPQRPKDELDSTIKALGKLGPVQLEDEEDLEDGIANDQDHRKTFALQNFKCMQAHVMSTLSSIQGPNDYVIEKLRVMQEYYETSRDPADKWKPRGYRLAIAALKKEKAAVQSFAQAVKLPSVGERLASHIVEIVNSGTMSKIDNIGDDYNVIQMFLGIYGVGPITAHEFVQKGFKTLEALSESNLLTKHQKLGIFMYEDFNTRIPREEVYQHKQVVSHEAGILDPLLQVYAMGSFRRGAKDCGDIDLLITRKHTPMSDLVRIWQKLLFILQNGAKFLTHTLVSSEHKSGVKWQGVSKLSKPGARSRRIDFIVVPWEQRGAALLYFTGSDLFNRSMRLLARKKGFRLNEKGLWRNPMRGRAQIKITEGENTGAQTEQDIFDALGIPFRRPEERCIST